MPTPRWPCTECEIAKLGYGQLKRTVVMGVAPQPSGLNESPAAANFLKTGTGSGKLILHPFIHYQYPTRRKP
jgi:hypothetical protein